MIPDKEEKMKDFNGYAGWRTRCEILGLCRTQGVRVVSDDGKQWMKLVGGRCVVWYESTSGGFSGTTPTGKEFRADFRGVVTVFHLGKVPQLVELPDWLQALMGFFWLKLADTPKLTRFVSGVESLLRDYDQEIDEGTPPGDARHHVVLVGSGCGYLRSEIERALDLRIAERKGQQSLAL